MDNNTDNMIGRRLDGRYELLELIGTGGMADIYKAKDITEDRIVAVKILKNEFAGSEDFLRRFRNESKAIALLSHPNIVKIYDVGFNEQIQFIVMEYIDGISLAEYIKLQGVLKWKDAVYFTIQILRALQHAHDRGIVHRDIKSQNVMMLPDGTIKVMDFGIARFNRETDKTLSEKAIGSVHYISPEQARGEMTDEKSDIYFNTLHSNADCLRECIGVNEKSRNLRCEPNYNYVDNLCSNGKGRKGYKRSRNYYF